MKKMNVEVQGRDDETGLFLGPLVLAALLGTTSALIAFIVTGSFFAAIGIYYACVASVFLLICVINFLQNLYSVE